MAHSLQQDVVATLSCTDATSAVSVCQRESERDTESVNKRHVDELHVYVLAGEVRHTER